MERGARNQATIESAGRLLERMQPELRSFLRRHGVPNEDADDLLTEAFLNFAHKQGSIRRDRSWLKAAVRKRCVKYLRARQRRLCHNVDTAVLELVAKHRNRHGELGGFLTTLDTALARIPSRCSSLLRLRYRLGHSAAEVEQGLNYNGPGARWETSRCVSALTRQLITASSSKENGHV